MRLRRAPTVVFLALAAGIWAFAPASSANAARTPDVSATTLEVFVREDCPRCAEAKRYLATLQRERPELVVEYRPVDRDAAAREELTLRSRRAGIWPPGVPTFAVGERLLVGFATAERSGPGVIALIDAAAANGDIGPPAPGAANLEHVESSLFGTLSAERMGLPLFTLALGLLDGFNPCAMWVLLFLLSLLVHLRDRRRMALIAGTFVLVSGAVYYAFMAAWLNVFLAVGMTRPLRLLLGAVALALGAVNLKDFVAFGRGPTLSIPDAAKPGIYSRVRAVLRAETLTASLLAVAVLAVLVNFVELLCTAGFPAIYTAVLTRHGLEPWAHYAYLGLYILGYVADDSLMVTLAVVTLGSRKLTERGGRWLKLLSAVVMLALGATLLLRPDWLM